MPLYWIIAVFIAYIIGSIPFGAIIGRGVAHIDITQMGSGNIGATNVARELGLKWGLITLVLDLLKGFVPVYVVCQYLNPSSGLVIIAISMSTLLGHQFSMFRRFHGGKGVATSLGIFLGLTPLAATIALLLFIIIVYVSDFVSLGSIIAACFMPLILSFLGEAGYLIIISIITAVMICYKHKENIRGLLRGKERRWRIGLR